MEAKTIKISAANYKRLNELAGELQKKVGKPVSVDKALNHLLRKGDLLDVAGGWKMSDKEETEIMKSIRRGWKNWKTSV
ncbi:MAG TPA: hypothetical protein VJG90_05605 [Candidatus Nanoarchaeia archaeon]|nr:hypothetical protein [Candidatus Nanoarchaeia archaeon]